MLTALAGTVLLGTGLLGAPAASAAETTAGAAAATSCDAGYYCVYRDADYAGRKYQFGGNNSSWADFNDDSSSWNNGTSGMGVILYGDEGYSRPLGCLPAGRGWTLHRPNDDGEGNKDLELLTPLPHPTPAHPGRPTPPGVRPRPDDEVPACPGPARRAVRPS
ncbi:peptidase inhibitor family I36 protein [Streptomyces sp. NPDC056194]|uniref:peptidase inhibitor family I36 protein n=1 Tax=unclassified Streptomyces TaxID=2593676 RepID=UPI0035DFAF75